jgi:segregation and condensation protein A
MIAARDAGLILDDRELASFTGWRVELPDFQGPIDLLVYLVQRGQVDPLELELAQITAAYIEEMTHQLAQAGASDGQRLSAGKPWEQCMAELEAVGEFLFSTATLLELKSRALLPIDKVDAVEEEEPGPLELAARAMEYELFRQAAQELRLRAQRQELVFLRPPESEGDGDGDDWQLASQVSAEQLWLQFRKVLERAAGGPVIRIERLVLTVQQQMSHVLRKLYEAGESGLGLAEVFEGLPTRLELIVTFLALLELVRLRRARIFQEFPFGPIRVYWRARKPAQVT